MCLFWRCWQVDAIRTMLPAPERPAALNGAMETDTEPVGVPSWLFRSPTWSAALRAPCASPYLGTKCEQGGKRRAASHMLRGVQPYSIFRVHVKGHVDGLSIRALGWNVLGFVGNVRGIGWV